MWSISNLGEGYGSLAVRGDRIYVQGVQGRDSAVFCLNRSDGKTLWTTALAGRMEQDRGDGPRGTPTLDGDRVFVLAENGELACLRAQDGAKIWRRNILQDFDGRNPALAAERIAAHRRRSLDRETGRLERLHRGAGQEFRERPSGPARA